MKTKLSWIAGTSILVLGVAIWLIPELFVVKSGNQTPSNEFADGRRFQDLNESNHYDHSSYRGAHRIGKIEGDENYEPKASFNGQFAFEEKCYSEKIESDGKVVRKEFLEKKKTLNEAQGVKNAPLQPPVKADAKKLPGEDPLGAGVAVVPQTPSLDKNAYYGSDYVAGGGHLARMRKLMDSGVQVNGKQVRLESFVKQYQQRLPRPQHSALEIHLHSSHQMVLSQPQGSNIILQVALAASDQKMQERLPLNVCLVLDRSGSMRDENKMEFAKQAASHLVSMLTPRDYFSLVTYDTRVMIPIPSTPVNQPDTLNKIIREITTAGSTNIYGGLEAGYEQIKKHFSPEFFNVVLLLSDGKANVGPSSPEAISLLSKNAFDHGIQTSSIGVGLDFNDAIMLAVANQGHGNYHFIDNPEWISNIIQEEFQPLDSLIAMAVKTRIQLHEKVDLVRVLGMYQLSNQEVTQVKHVEKTMDQRLEREYGIQSNRNVEEENGIKFFKNHFLSGEYQLYLLEVRVPPGLENTPLAQVEIKFKDLLTRQNGATNQSLTLPFTSEESQFITSINREVKRNQLGFETGYILKSAASLVERGQTKKACEQILAHTRLVLEVGKAYSDGDLLADGEILQRYYETLRPFEMQDIASQPIGKYFVKTFNFQGFRRAE